MAEDETLIGQIEHNLAHMPRYADWTIGVTSHPEVRQRELEYPSFWRLWKAHSPAAADETLEHFVARGMKRDPNPNPGKSPVFVYLY